MNSYNLGGHSGCRVCLIEPDNGEVFVRKKSKSPEYNSRLDAQCKKQSQFKSGKIKTPMVLRTGIDENGLHYFDMEYVQGITLAEYIRNVEIGKIRGIVSALVENIDTSEKPDCTNEANEFFSAKLADLQGKLSGKDPIIDSALALLAEHDWSVFKPSFCHGDLTLENIIVKNDELYFIDFLDSFYDSYLMDLGTLLQDIQSMWSYREEEKPDMNLILRLIVFRNLLLDAIRKKDSALVREVYFSLLQKLVRILPYTEDKKTYGFLLGKISSIILEIS